MFDAAMSLMTSHVANVAYLQVSYDIMTSYSLYTLFYSLSPCCGAVYYTVAQKLVRVHFV